MATLERPLKEGNVRTYQAKVALGFLDILASEVDADCDTIYAAWNGGLPADSVGTTQLISGAVTQPKLATNAVGTAQLIDAQVTQAKLANNAVGTAQLIDTQVTTAKLAAQATTPSSAMGSVFEVIVAPLTTTVVAGANITVRAVALLVGGVVGHAISTVDAASGASCQCQLFRDTTQVMAWIIVPPGANTTYQISFPVTFLETTTGVHGYQLKIVTGAGTTVYLDAQSGFNRHGSLVGIAFA
jgi:hypothetical protein